MVPSKSGERVKHTVAPYYNNGRSMTIDSIENGNAHCFFQDEEGIKHVIPIPIGELEVVSDPSDFMVIF